MPSGNLGLIGLSCNIYHKIDKEEIRKFLVEGVDILLESANHNTTIRPFMKNYPFTPANIDLSICIYHSKEHKRTADPDIGIASAYKNKIIYCTFEPEKEFGYKSEIEESFAEASKIVHAD